MKTTKPRPNILRNMSANEVVISDMNVALFLVYHLFLVRVIKSRNFLNIFIFIDITEMF